MKSDAMAERIAKRYITLSGHSTQFATSLDWMSIAVEIGAALIPVIKDCIANRRGASSVAEFAKSRPLLTRIAVRNGLGNEGVKLTNRRIAVNAVMDEIEASSDKELTASLQEVVDDA